MVRYVLKLSFSHHRQVSVPHTSCHLFISTEALDKSLKVMICDLEIYSGNSAQLCKSFVVGR